MPTTTELLPTLNADVLKALARQLGLAKTVTRKPELIAELDRYVRDNLRNFLAHCSATEKQLLAEAAHSKGWVDPTAFRAKYGVACPLPENPHWGTTKTLLLLLLDYQGGMWEMPHSVAERLRVLLEKPAPVAIRRSTRLRKTAGANQKCARFTSTKGSGLPSRNCGPY
jgi:hypothetical protein